MKKNEKLQKVINLGDSNLSGEGIRTTVRGQYGDRPVICISILEGQDGDFDINPESHSANSRKHRVFGWCVTKHGDDVGQELYRPRGSKHRVFGYCVT